MARLPPKGISFPARDKYRFYRGKLAHGSPCSEKQRTEGPASQERLGIGSFGSCRASKVWRAHPTLLNTGGNSPPYRTYVWQVEARLRPTNDAGGRATSCLKLFGDSQVQALDPEVAVAEEDGGVNQASAGGADARVDVAGRRKNVVEVHEGVADVKRRAGGEAVAEVQADFGDRREFVAGAA